MLNQDFFVTTMPPSRPADYCLGYLDSCVFLDFNNVDKNKVCLKRISFDGYGCCELTDGAIPLSEVDSTAFKDTLQDRVGDQNKVRDHVALRILIRKAIALNKDLIWIEALEEYELL